MSENSNKICEISVKVYFKVYRQSELSCRLRIMQVCTYSIVFCIYLINLVFLDRLYTDKHEWITVDGKIGTVGASNYAQVPE